MVISALCQRACDSPNRRKRLLCALGSVSEVAAADALEVRLIDSTGTVQSMMTGDGGTFSFGEQPIGAYTLKILAGSAMAWPLCCGQPALRPYEDSYLWSLYQLTTQRLALTWDSSTAASLDLQVSFAMGDSNCSVSEGRPRCGGLWNRSSELLACQYRTSPKALRS